jgi:hypothetical protein
MIVVRYTWKVNHIHHSEFIKLLKAMIEEAGLTPRVCSHMFGPRDTVSSELEFETIEDWRAWWGDVDWSKPAVTEFEARYPDLAEIGMTAELLRIH